MKINKKQKLSRIKILNYKNYINKLKIHNKIKTTKSIYKKRNSKKIMNN